MINLFKKVFAGLVYIKLVQYARVCEWLKVKERISKS